jgi:hypothetical protein
VPEVAAALRVAADPELSINPETRNKRDDRLLKALVA